MPTTEQIALIVENLFTMKHRDEADPKTLRTLAGIFHTVLADIPLDGIREAARMILSGTAPDPIKKTYVPTPAEFGALARERVEFWRTKASLLRYMSGLPVAQVQRELPEADRKAMAGKLSALMATLRKPEEAGQ